MPLEPVAVLKRYKRVLADGKSEHDKVLEDADQYYAAYGLNSIRGRDFAGLSKIWGDHPPEVGMMLSNVNTFWGNLITSRREPTFPGFDQSPQDEVLGEMLTMLLKAGRRWAGSDAVDEEALTDLIVAGYGFVEETLETERPPFKPRERHVPLSDVWWERCNGKNLRDGQAFIVQHRYTVSEAVARFPGKAATIRAVAVNRGAQDDTAPREGAQSLGGATTAVTINSTASSGGSGGLTERTRPIVIHDFQFVEFEQLASWEMNGQRVEATLEEYNEAMKMLAEQEMGMVPPPKAHIYAEGTWYRARVLAHSPLGEPQILEDAVPIPGNQRLIRAMTGYAERYKDGDELRTRFFGFGRVLLGLQRLASVAIRIYLEQEARRNRTGGSVESDAFESQTEFDQWVEAQSIPGAYPQIPPGAFDKIHPNEGTISPHVTSMQQLFQFLSVDLVSHMLGISDVTRGTETSDRMSAKFAATMQESALQMQTRFTTAFTDYLAEGAVTMARLMLLNLDAKDIDRLLGAQPPREGINAQKNPQTGALEPIMETNPETGEKEPVTYGAFLKSAVGELFDQDVGFALRASAASERMANAMLMTQHGFLETLAKLLPPEAGELLAPAALKGSFAQGTTFADVAEKIETFLAQRKAQQEQQAKAATEEGWVQFIAEMAQTDFDKAAQLMQSASQALTGPGEVQ